MVRRQLIKYLVKPWHITSFASSDHESHPRRLVYTSRVDFGGKASPRAAQSLCGLTTIFFNAPAACWWARTIVLSIKICFATFNASSCNPAHNFCQTPRCSHRRNRFYTASHCPNPSGRSRHGTPVRATYNTASRNIRSLCLGGLPALCFTRARMVAISCQAASDRMSRSALIALPPYCQDGETANHKAINSSTRPSTTVVDRMLSGALGDSYTHGEPLYNRGNR
jgi:hypothetical protein